MLEKLRSQVKELEADIMELETIIKEKAAAKKNAVARLQSRMFLEMVFQPYVEGLSKGLGMSLENGMIHLIENEITLDRLANENREAVDEFLDQPECKVIMATASPLAEVTDDWMKEKLDVLLDVMEEVDPIVVKSIKDTPGGRDWFINSLIGLRDIFFGKPKINEVFL